jgi:hypothetical protein
MRGAESSRELVLFDPGVRFVERVEFACKRLQELADACR